jgi:L,D-transpeptidase catalytic domain
MRRHAVILAAALTWLISIESAEAKLDILVDKATQRMLVMQDGYMRYIWPVSTGRDETATPNGVYVPQRLERSWFSRAYYNSPMPYSIFFHNGYAIHGSYAIDRLGGPASHGCVRLHPHHAELLFDMVQQEGPDQTTIEITEDARPDRPPLPGREIAPLSGRQIAALPGREIAALPGREAAPLPGREIAPMPWREVAAGRGMPYPPEPRIIRYRETGDMPQPLPPVQHGYRPLALKTALPSRPPPPPLSPPPASRRVLADVRPPANVPPANVPPANVPTASVPTASVPRAPCGAGEADPARGSARPSDESSDCRPKPKVAEASRPEPDKEKKAPSMYGFRLLPASCWSGGASRWRSLGTPCK